jgi:DNA polymerase I
MSKLPFYLEDPGPHWYDQVPWLALDLETTNVEYGDPWLDQNRIVVGANCGESRPKLVPSESYAGGGITCPQVLVAHNAKFELGWLHRSGYDIKDILPWDTMIAEYVLAGNRKWALDLGSVCKRYGLPYKDPVIDSMMKGGVCPSEMPRHWLEARVLRDVETTYQLAKLQKIKLEAAGLMPVFFTRCITTPVLTLIEGEGMKLDADRVRTETDKQRLELLTLERELALTTGGINLNSPKQLGEYLYDKLGFSELTNRRGQPIRTAAGGRMTDSDTLAALKASTPEQRAFLEQKQEHATASARLTKSLEFFADVCENHDGVFRGRFNQCVTQTHRLSASGRPIKCKDGKKRGVQFQNLPREYKKLFTAKKPKHVVIETDGAQLEFRVAGSLSKDDQILRDVTEGADIHRSTASAMLGIDEAKVTDKQRTEAKADTFGPMYGRLFGTKKQLAYIEYFQLKYKALNDTQNAWVSEVLRTKQLRTATGLIFYFPEAKIRHDGAVEGRTNVFNYPIQSFATADIIPISLAYTFWTTRDYAKLVNTVHDSVVAEVHEDDIGLYKSDSIDCWGRQTYRYLDMVYGIKLHVPLGLGIKVASHWGDTKNEEKIHLTA